MNKDVSEISGERECRNVPVDVSVGCRGRSGTAPSIKHQGHAADGTDLPRKNQMYNEQVCIPASTFHSRLLEQASVPPYQSRALDHGERHLLVIARPCVSVAPHIPLGIPAVALDLGWLSMCCKIVYQVVEKERNRRCTYDTQPSTRGQLDVEREPKLAKCFKKLIDFSRILYPWCAPKGEDWRYK